MSSASSEFLIKKRLSDSDFKCLGLLSLENARNGNHVPKNVLGLSLELLFSFALPLETLPEDVIEPLPVRNHTLKRLQLFPSQL